jgi:hypothetical protein
MITNPIVSQDTTKRNKRGASSDNAGKSELHDAPEVLLLDLAMQVEQQANYWSRMKHKVKRELNRRQERGQR